MRRSAIGVGLGAAPLWSGLRAPVNGALRPSGSQDRCQGTLSCTDGAGSPRLGTYSAPQAVHNTAATIASRAVAYSRKRAGADVRG